MGTQNVPTTDAVKEYHRKNSTPWQPDVPYNVDDIVFSSDGGIYRCILDHNQADPYDSPEDPAGGTNTTYWEPLGVGINSSGGGYAAGEIIIYSDSTGEQAQTSNKTLQSNTHMDSSPSSTKVPNEAAVADALLTQLAASYNRVARSAVTDWDNYTESGFYSGNSLSNSPDLGGTWVQMIVIRHVNDGSYCTQLAFNLTDNSKHKFAVRYQNAGSWTSWEYTQTTTSVDSDFLRTDIQDIATRLITLQNGLHITGHTDDGSAQIRFVQDDYGFMFRNDGTNFYLLLTDSGDQYGSWNSFRPLTVNNSTGQVTLGNRMIIPTSGDPTIDGNKIWHSGNDGIAGAIVGTTDSQTLTNKTLTSPDINSPDIDGGTVNGITSLTVANNVDIGGYELRARTLEADVATGTAPFTVASTTKVTNLNADLLDGKSAPSGSIVGTTDSQTLTNKTLTSPDINSPDIDGGTVNGITSLTVANNVDIGNYELKARTFESDVVTGTAPFSITSTSLVTNLNADRVDNLHAWQLVRSDTSDIVNGTLTFNAIPAFNGGTSGSSSPFTVDSTHKVTNLNADLLDGASLSTATGLGTSNTLIPSQNAVKTYVDAAKNAVWPIGATYIQFPGRSSPTTLGLPGTWIEDSAMAGDFLRFKGTAGNGYTAKTFETGEENDAVERMEGEFEVRGAQSDSEIVSNLSGVFNVGSGGSTIYAVDLIDELLSERTIEFDNANVAKTNSVETRPVYRTVVLWRRSA